MGKLNKAQQKKRDFRKSKKWLNFRKKKMNDQKGIDPITGCKLTGRWNCHHKNLNEEEYENIEQEENFIAINRTTHDAIHWILRYVKKYKDLRALNNFYDEIVRESKLNGYID